MCEACNTENFTMDVVTKVYELDMAIETLGEMDESLKTMNRMGVRASIINLIGPGGGWPEFRIEGTEEKVREALKAVHFDCGPDDPTVEPLETYEVAEVNQIS